MVSCILFACFLSLFGCGWVFSLFLFVWFGGFFVVCFMGGFFCARFLRFVLVLLSFKEDIIFQTRDLDLISFYIFYCVFLAHIIHQKVGLLQRTHNNLQFLSGFEIRQISKIKSLMATMEI